MNTLETLAQEEDRRGQRTRDAHRRSHSHARRGLLLSQALFQSGSGRRIAAPKRSPGRRPNTDQPPRRRLSEAHRRERPTATLSRREARVLAKRGRARGKRVHRQQDASSYGMDPQKRRVGASERELEFLWAARRTFVVGKIDAESLLFVDETGSNAPLAPLHA